MKLLRLAEQQPEMAVGYLVNAESLANSNFLRQRLNREWVYYYHAKRNFDSALYYVNLNLLREFTNDSTKLIQEEVAQSYGAKRAVLVGLGRFNETFDPLFKAVEIFEKFNINNFNHASALVNIGIDYWRIDEFKSSLEQLDKAIQFSKKYNFHDALLRAYITKGLVYKSLNQLNLAEEYYKYVFELIGSDVEQNARDFMASCNNLGLVYMDLEKMDSALSYYQKGLALIASGKIEGNFSYLIPFYSSVFQVNIGNIRLQQEDFKSAELHFMRSIKTMQASYGSSHPFQIESYQGVAESCLGLEEYEKALNYTHDLLELYHTNDMNSALGYNLLGSIYSEWEGHQHMALPYYDSAIMLNPQVIIDEQEISSFPELYAESLAGKVKILLDQNEFTIEQVERLFKSAVSLIRQTNQLVPSVSIKRDVNEVLNVFYQAYDKLSLQRDQKLIANQRKWEITQLNRAAILKTQLQDQYSMTFSVPDSILIQEKLLKDRLDSRISLMEPGKIDSSLFVMKREYDRFIERIEKEFPRYAKLKKVSKLSSLKDKMNSLGSTEIMLAFFEGQNKLFLLKISINGIVSKTIEKSELYKIIEEFNVAILTHSVPELIKNSSKLKSALLLTEEDLESINHIEIAPDGNIWKLDFGVLATDKEGLLNFLGQQITFSYDLLLEDFEVTQGSESEEVVAFSYDSLSKANNNEPSIQLRDLDSALPGTSKEVKTISEIWEGRYYYSNRATETVFKNEATQALSPAILHLALHGYQDDIYPEHSFLKFASHDSLNDGRLHSYELYNLRLKAPLAVLSACNSGSGKVEAGEGMVSLARAFAYAGVQSILATRWEVPDHTAPIIMKYFYEGLKTGMKKSAALQYAQRMYLENDATNVEKAPFFWAGYYILGNDDPVVEREFRLSKIGIGIISILLLFLISVFTMARKKRAL